MEGAIRASSATKAIGWIALACGACMAVFGVTLAATATLALGDGWDAFVRDFRLAALLEAVLGVLLVTAGRAVLKLRRRGVVAVQALSFALSVHVVGSCTFLMLDAQAQFSDAPASFRLLIGATFFVITLFWVVGLAAVILALRRFLARETLAPT